MTVWMREFSRKVCLYCAVTHAVITLCIAITVWKNWQTNVCICVIVHTCEHCSHFQCTGTKITDGVFQWQWASVTERCSMAGGLCCEWCGGDLRAILSSIVHLLPPFTCIWTWSYSSQGTTAATMTTLVNCRSFTQGQQHLLRTQLHQAFDPISE